MPFHYEDYSGTDLDVIQRLSPAHYLDQYRNERAVQSAILRGDEEVILTNTSTLAGLKEPRYVHPPYIHQRNPYEVKFRELRSPESEDGLTENDIRERLDREWKGFRLEFLKILGTGGLGSGTLWKVHLEGGVTKQVVIKVPKTEESYSEEESEWHKRYEGSRHTVQYVDLAKMASDARDAYKAKYPDMPCQYDRGSDFISDEATGMPLEFMSRGDLFRIMKTASTKRLKRFPDKALWGIWECLVKGAAAMAYQPRANKWNIVFENDMEKAEANGDLERFFEFLEAEPITHDIHLDLEESNILAGEDSAHPEQPVFKMHDFGGFSFAMNEAWGHRDEKFYWSRRKPTKMTRLTPEQVHQDWDTLRNNLPGREAVERFEGSDLTKGNPIAGRYGVWTNIFILAKTMEAVITQLYFVHPFTSDDYETMDGKSGRTYGWRLNEPEFDFVDPELRDILCECLFERPIDRPSILDLLRNIEARKKRGFPEQLGDLKWFWRKVFGPFATKPVRASAVPDAELDLEEVIRTNVMSSAERDARIYGDELDLEEIVRANVIASGEQDALIDTNQQSEERTNPLSSDERQARRAMGSQSQPGIQPVRRRSARVAITISDGSEQEPRRSTQDSSQSGSSSEPGQSARVPITITDGSGQGSRRATRESSLPDYEDSEESVKTNVMPTSEQRERLAGLQIHSQGSQARQESNKENRPHAPPLHRRPLWLDALIAAAEQPDPHLSQDRIAQSRLSPTLPASQQPVQEEARASEPESPPHRESLRSVLSFFKTDAELDAHNALSMRHVSSSPVPLSSQGSTTEESGSDEGSDFERLVKRPRTHLETNDRPKKRVRFQDDDVHLSMLCRQLSVDSELTSPLESPRDANMARFKSTSRVKKVPSPKAKSQLKTSTPKSPHPTAIQNLLVRSQQLEKRLGYKTVDQVSKPAWEK